MFGLCSSCFITSWLFRKKGEKGEDVSRKLSRASPEKRTLSLIKSLLMEIAHLNHGSKGNGLSIILFAYSPFAILLANPSSRSKQPDEAAEPKPSVWSEREAFHPASELNERYSWRQR